MSSPSFLVRLRSRARRQESELDLQLPDDHWHSGDPRMLDGSLALKVRDVREARDVPVPRRSSESPRPELTVVPQIDVRGSVVDLRRPSSPSSPSAPPAQRPWTETSTWLG